MLEKHFDFNTREKDIYKQWEEAGVFRLEACTDAEAPIFNMTMPPPNANGELHIGHSYGYTVMDTLGRFHRLLGERVMLLPGKDHAGIQTQVVFEKKLREEGVEVEKLSRDEFYQKCYDFCIDRSHYMRAQEKSLGAGVDWDKEIFTLDPRVSETVFETFKMLYDEGLVYKGSRIVHWSVYSQTAISDVEIEYREEPGKLWHFAYPIIDQVEQVERKSVEAANLGGEILKNRNAEKVLLVKEADLKVGEVIVLEEEEMIIHEIRRVSDTSDQEMMKVFEEAVSERLIKLTAASGEAVLAVMMVPVLPRNDAVVVATTRPETMLGDSAIAVHSGDPRYSHLIGKRVQLPLAERELKIIADDRIDITYGTGAVKVTPAHDFLDYEIGVDHELEQIQVIDKNGLMTDLVPEQFRGMEILKCREAIVHEMAELGLLLKTEDMKHKVPIAERGKDIIEPLISEQWFVNVDKEGNSLKKRALELVRSGRLNVFPERLRKMIEQWLVNLRDWNISRQIIWGHRMPVWYKNRDTASEELHIGVDSPGADWEQETDTFDTWFSSGQWPFTTIAANGLLDLKEPTSSKHFPTTSMVMGRDILLFWACRMLLFSTFRFNDIPWKNIYFTGLIRDAQGKKMSKSRANGVEPTEMIERYGVDALRMSFIAANKPGVDVKFSEKKVEGYSKFVNKLWNAAKLVGMKLDERFDHELPEEFKLESSKWILHELRDCNNRLIDALSNYELAEAFDLIYHFTWDIFCAWYLEIIKLQMEGINKAEAQAVTQFVFRRILVLLHSFAPFVTEEIYQKMDRLGGGNFLAVERLNRLDFEYGELRIADAFEIISALRRHRKVLDISFNDRLQVETDLELSAESRELVVEMGRVEMVDSVSGSIITKPVAGGRLMIETPDKDKSLYLAKIEKELQETEKQIKADLGRLNSDFVKKAPAELVEEVRQNNLQNQQKAEILRKEISLN